MTGISVVSDYYKLGKYNIRTINDSNVNTSSGSVVPSAVPDGAEVKREVGRIVSKA